jgi:chromosome segregation ATPase
MIRKILAGILIGLSAILLGLSIAGIILIAANKEPLKQVSTARLQALDREVEQAQTTLQKAELELERTLRTVEAAEISLKSLKADFTQAKAVFGSVNGTLEKQLLPGLKASRQNIVQAQSTLQNLRTSLAELNALPLVNLNLPGDELLAELLAGAGSLDTQITQVETLVKKASTFMEDASYLMAGDFTETKTNLQNFILVVQAYDQRISGWRNQLAWLRASLPGWIEATALGLMIFLLWFGFSQVSLMLHGLAFWHGNAPGQPTRPTPEA